ncbi:MAG TPA: alpha/beta hydrolase [Solirubrobacteraceae bacterium]|nr:alpha/beta hydrolase [Solirubrobacteraceae bacterium]
MTLAQVGEIELDYDRAGAGEPLLAIMGMSGTKVHWGQPFLESLRRDFELVVYDHRGVGSSSRLHGPLTIAQLAQDAARLLDALELHSAHVLGISMGGMVAQELALAHPEKIRTLTLGCTYCGGDGSALASQDVMSRLAEAMTSGDRQRAIRTAWEVNVSPAFADDHDAFARFLDLGLHNAVPVDVIMAQMQAIMGHNTAARLPSIALPTQVLHGTVDQMLPVQNARQIASLIPDARLEIFDHVGHLFFWERPEPSAELLRAHAAVHA